MAKVAGARLRDLLLESVRGAGEPLTDALAAFAAWRTLSVLWQTGWLGPDRGSPAAVRAEVRRRFRELAAAHCPVAALAHKPVGQMVCLRGKMVDVGTAPDFRLDDETADPVVVQAAGARVLGGGGTAMAGQDLTVLGFLDRIVDPAVSASVPRQPPLRSVIRAGDCLPLIVVIE